MSSRDERSGSGRTWNRLARRIRSIFVGSAASCWLSEGSDVANSPAAAAELLLVSVVLSRYTRPPAARRNSHQTTGSERPPLPRRSNTLIRTSCSKALCTLCPAPGKHGAESFMSICDRHSKLATHTYRERHRERQRERERERERERRAHTHIPAHLHTLHTLTLLGTHGRTQKVVSSVKLAEVVEFVCSMWQLGQLVLGHV